MTGTYKFAEKTVGISSLYRDIHSLCSDYRCTGDADFCVSTAPGDIEKERAFYEAYCSARGEKNTDYPDSYLEELAVYRKIAEKMPFFGTVLFHCSAVAVDGQAYLFAAASGTGKSTHVSFWREMLGDRAVMVNDDKPLLHIGETGATVYGTPWDGKHRLSNNTAVPVKALCLLTRGSENRIYPVMPKEALPVLLQQVYRPSDISALSETLKLINKLCENVPLYRLECTPTPDAAEIAYEEMRG